jgi:ketopantoate reductase
VHVAVLGAGALGAVYGARIALRTEATVTFVVRPARASSRQPIAIERVKGALREELAAPARSAVVPPDADVVLVAVGSEDLDALRAPLGESEAPLVVLTPMMPAEHARMQEAFGRERVFAAMASVVSYAREDGVFRYWQPPQPTRIDEPRAGGAGEPVRALAALLERAGIGARLELAVHEANPATTVCFIAIPMALAVAGSAKELTADEALLSLASRACREGAELGRRLGRPEPWAAFAPLAASTTTIRAGFALLRRLSPEGLFYAEEHFGRKLRIQHRLMAQAMLDLARAKGTPHEAIAELAALL